VKDLTGQVFTRLTVIAYVERRRGISVWRCLCSCGNEKIASMDNLNRGYTKSCGCLKFEYIHNQKNRLIHGMKHTTLYTVWQNMNRRCSDPTTKSYKDYGARGIKVCKKWRNAAGFFDDMKDSWRPGLTIERVNNDLGYNKDNCIWVPKARQTCNTRTTRWVLYQGVRMCLADAARKSGISSSTLNYRLRHNYSPEHLFTKVK